MLAPADNAPSVERQLYNEEEEEERTGTLPMFPGTYVLRYRCSPVPMFPGTDVPRILY